MPSRWFVPIVGVDPSRVRLEHVHAAFSGWFDGTAEAHAASDKPYAVSPLSGDERGVGVEIATLTVQAEAALARRVESGAPVRLGSQVRPLGRARLMHASTWEELAVSGVPGAATRWVLEFVTPATFRSGDRSSPLPQVPTILAGLARAWDACSGTPRPELRSDLAAATWVSDLDLRSQVLRLRVRRRHGAGTQDVHVSGATGSLTLRCEDPCAVEVVAPLLGLAPYVGVGAMRGKGLGVVRVRRIPQASETAGTRGVPAEHVEDGEVLALGPAR